MSAEEQRRRDNGPAATRSWPGWPLLVALAGLALTLLAWRSLRTTNDALRRKAFELDAQQRVVAIQQQFDERVGLFELFAPFYTAVQGEIDASQFRQFAHEVLRAQESIEALAFVPRVTAEQREQFEIKTRQTLGVFRISQRDSGGLPVPAAARSEYFPVLYVSSRKAPDDVRTLGYDLASDPQTRLVIDQAEGSKAFAALPGGIANRSLGPDLLLVLVPIYRDRPITANPGSTPLRCDGFIAGVLRISPVFQHALRPWEEQGMRIALHDVTSGHERRLLFQYDVIPTAGLPRAIKGPTGFAADVLLEVPYTFGSRDWEFHCWPATDYSGATWPWLPASSLVIGLLCTALGTSYAFRLAGRTSRIERLVAKRTSELERQIVERKQAQEALNESLAAYRSLIESLPLNCFRKDLQGHIVSANSRFCETVGRSPEEVLGRTDSDLFPPEQAGKYRADDLRVIESGAVLEDIEQHVTTQGERLFVQVLKAPARDAQGQIVGVQGMFWDVTQREQLEEARRHSDARFRRLVESNIIGVVTGDENGRILDANDAFLALVGIGREELQTGLILWDDLTPAEYHAQDREALQRLRAAGKCAPWEKELYHRDGRRLAVLVGITLLEGEHPEAVSFVLDITERKKMENELKQAKEAADAANQAKSQFLANMSHEIRTPMNAIIGMTEVALHTPLTPDQREHLTLVLESGESLLHIINDILDFSKVEAGRLDLDSRAFQLREAIGDALKALALRAHVKQLELACDIEERIPELLVGDVGRLRQVVTNLIGNAIKFTEQGEVVLGLRLEQETADSVRLHGWVRDTGIGIPADKQTVIFNAFEQVDSTATRRHGGTGLGLAIAASLLELMQGGISVESRVGEGSTFHFHLTLGKSGSTSLLPPTAVPTEVAAARVLVVDDNATTRHILERMLANWGIRPQLAATAQEALAHLEAAAREQKAFDVLLADAKMPRCDGFSLARQVRMSPQFAGTRIVMMVSGDRPADAQICEQLGIEERLMKPVLQSELMDALVATLSSGRGVTVAVPESDLASYALPPLRILLAEDSLVNQKLACTVLQRQGHTLVIADNGRLAVARVQDEPFDLVLMDVQMPEMDGLEATARIRRWEQVAGGHVPIVAMTAHAMQGDRERCLEAGMDDYVAKPIRTRELLDTIRRVVQSRSDTNMAEMKPQAVADVTSPATAREEVAINWRSALESVAGQADLLRELIELYLQEAPRLLEQMRAALDAGDAATFQRAAHTLKGSSRYFGPNAVGDLARQLEQLGAAGDLAGAPESLTELRSALEQLLPPLQRALAEGIPHMGPES